MNRALEPRDVCLVIAVPDGELTIKRPQMTPAGVVLQAAVPTLSDLTIWNVATTCLPHVCGGSSSGCEGRDV